MILHLVLYDELSVAIRRDHLVYCRYYTSILEEAIETRLTIIRDSDSFCLACPICILFHSFRRSLVCYRATHL